MTTDELADDIAARQADDDRLRNPTPAPGEWWERCTVHGWYRPFSVIDADCGTCRTDDRIAREDAHYDHQTSYPRPR